MFKLTSERLNHRERVASHSTKEHANGRIDMVPPTADQPEDYFNGAAESYRTLRSQLGVLDPDTEEAFLVRGRLRGLRPWRRKVVRKAARERAKIKKRWKKLCNCSRCGREFRSNTSQKFCSASCRQTEKGENRLPPLYGGI